MLYKCCISGVDSTTQYEELIKVFLLPDEYEMVSQEASSAYLYDFMGDKNLLKRQIYNDLRKITGKRPKWGILTGIRPVKIAGELYDELGTVEGVTESLRKKYLIHPDKIRLVCNILKYQREKAGKPKSKSLSMYIGIPFCPTRCLYCSFTSNQVKEGEIDRYMTALYREIEYVSHAIREGGLSLESIYIGGGTPTTLNESQMEELLLRLTNSFSLEGLKELTVEAGRPDTITEKKLQIMKQYGVGRISINPQTMKDETLEIIGRRHSSAQTIEAFDMASQSCIDTVNADLIAGLPGETATDFKNSLESIINLGADNITLHTLAVKRASRLKETDSDYNYRKEALCEEMLTQAHQTLYKQGYLPYYLYRQKHTSGNTENIGFCRADKLSVYNIRIMEEHQSILALGAGGISKIYFPAQDRLERVPNVSNYQIYIDRIGEMIERKQKGFFFEE